MDAEERHDRAGARGLTAPRLTGGSAKGRSLRAVPAMGVRPSSARVREALFSMVGQDLSGLRVLDAFGGSGLLGLEAWSRGARVVVVEKDRRAVQVIRGNVDALGAEVEVTRGDVVALASRLGPFDGVLADPPYAMDPAPVMSALAGCTRGWMALEHASSTEAPLVEGWRIERQRTYGGTALAVYGQEEG